MRRLLANERLEMKFKPAHHLNKYLLGVLECVLIVNMLSACDEIFRNPYIREISSDVELSENWTELNASPPLEVVNMMQSIEIEFPEIINWNIEHPDKEKWYENPYLTNVIMSDGKIIKIDVQVVAKDGTVFEMNSISILLGKRLIFTHLPKGLDLAKSKTTLPKEKEYIKVRVRTSLPIRTGKVLWVGSTNH